MLVDERERLAPKATGPLLQPDPDDQHDETVPADLTSCILDWLDKPLTILSRWSRVRNQAQVRRHAQDSKSGDEPSTMVEP